MRRSPDDPSPSPSSSSGVELPHSHPLGSEDHAAGLPGKRGRARTQALAGQAVLGVGGVFHAEEQVVFVVRVQHEDLILTQGWKGDRDGAEVSSKGGARGSAPPWPPPGEDWAGSASCSPAPQRGAAPSPKPSPGPSTMDAPETVHRLLDSGTLTTQSRMPPGTQSGQEMGLSRRPQVRLGTAECGRRGASQARLHWRAALSHGNRGSGSERCPDRGQRAAAAPQGQAASGATPAS